MTTAHNRLASSRLLKNDGGIADDQGKEQFGRSRGVARASRYPSSLGVPSEADPLALATLRFRSMVRSGTSRRGRDGFVVAVAVVVLVAACGSQGEPSSVPPSSEPGPASSASSPPPSASLEPSPEPPPSSALDCFRDLGRVNEEALIVFPPPGPVE